jgi:hypothetical protein
MAALAYLLTFTTYGIHLPGSEKGAVNIKHCIPGSPMLKFDPGRKTHWRSRLIDPPWVLDGEARHLTLQAILDVCAYANGWHTGSEATACRRRRYWTDHGSTRYLWNEESCKAAIKYVLNGQGAKMACYPA